VEKSASESGGVKEIALRDYPKKKGGGNIADQTRILGNEGEGTRCNEKKVLEDVVN